MEPADRVLKQDAAGQVWTPPEQRRAISDKFERSGLRYAAILGIGCWCFVCGCRQSPQQKSVRNIGEDADSARAAAAAAQAAGKKDGSNAFVLSEGGSSTRSPLRENIAPPSPASNPRMEKWKSIFLTELSGLPKGSPEESAKLHELWQRNWPKTFNRALASSVNPAVQRGTVLPAECEEARKSRDRGANMLENGLPFLTSDAEQQAGAALFLLSALDSENGARILPKVLAERAKSLPPTTGDMVVFAALASTSSDRVRNENSEMERWLPLAHAENPVYRLIAAESGWSAKPAVAKDISWEDPEIAPILVAARLQFYSEFEKETDPTILATVFRSLAGIGTDDARSELLRFHNQSDQWLPAVVDEYQKQLKRVEQTISKNSQG